MLTQIDPAIVRKAQRGDHDAFSAIVSAYRAPIRDYILRSVRDPELAEDLTQDVFVRAWRALPTYAFRSQLTTWLFQVAKNIVFDSSRARKSRITTIELLPELEPAAQSSTHDQ